MSRPKLWVDIDDVLSQTSAFAIKQLKAQHSIEWRYESITAHEWETLSGFPLDKKTMLLFWDRHLGDSESIWKIDPIEWAVESITLLAEKYELHAITARQQSMKEATKSWIESHFGKAFNSITHLGQEDGGLRKNKWVVCWELGVVAMIEDHMTYALTVAEQGIPCYLLPRPWNILREETHPLVLRRESWDEVAVSLLSSIDTRTWKSL